MAHVCIVITISALLYALYVHRDNDRYAEENYMLRRSLHMIADGNANIYKSNGVIHVEEKK